MNKLPRSFYTRPTITVAKELLGKIFVRKIGKKILSGRIVEVEAYLRNDPACHAFRGMTERNRVMFNEGGYLYVYFTYGMHYCANIVTYKEGIGEAVLIRAVEPVDGIEVMIKNRGFDKSSLRSRLVGRSAAVRFRLMNPASCGISRFLDSALTGFQTAEQKAGHPVQRGNLQNLTNGPANFAQAFGLTKVHSGIDLLDDDIYLLDAEPVLRSHIVSTTRIGINAAKEKKWRFYIKGNEWVSKK